MATWLRVSLRCEVLDVSSVLATLRRRRKSIMGCQLYLKTNQKRLS